MCAITSKTVDTINTLTIIHTWVWFAVIDILRMRKFELNGHKSSFVFISSTSLSNKCILFSQSAPENPVGHLHLYDVIPSIHVPSLKQGFDLQSSISENYQLLNSTYLKFANYILIFENLNMNFILCNKHNSVYQ